MAMSTEQVLAAMCEQCRENVLSVFQSNPRPPPEVIAGDRHHAECCFVADEIRLLDGGRLIFTPSGRTEPTGAETQEYCRFCFVVCRKLVIVEGGEPLPFDICGSEDPGNAYKGKNLITWYHRLETASDGMPPNPDQAAKGDPDWDRNVWQDLGQGSHGRDGGTGATGADGAPAQHGRSAPDFCLVCLEVEFQGVNAHLTIDFDGQVGGIGGRGQHGGPGGEGMGGRPGESDNTWPGEGCDRQSGNGGDGGDHGNGGTGGRGGNGGHGGDIYIISTLGNITAGPFVGGKIKYVNDGGNEGEGGLGGFGEPASELSFARGGRGGHAAPQHCPAGVDGDSGGPGWPPREPLKSGSELTQGADGSPGNAGTIALREILSDDCTDPIPVMAEITQVEPEHLCRGFSAPESNLPLTLTGWHLGQVTAVSFSLAGVSATILPTSNDTELNLLVDLTGASGTGPCDVTLERAIGAPMVFNGVFSVNRFEVLNVSPGNGPQGNVIPVTITGSCFDPTAVLQQVSVSGVGISVDNVIVATESTITCDLDIGQAAVIGQKDVTVHIGSYSHTLVNGFVVTP